jgi:glycerophosphoryl diester phosphodiesterase
VKGSQRDFPVVVFGPVVEAQDRRHGVVRPRPIERGHRIHATGAKHDDLHARALATKTAKTHKNKASARTKSGFGRFCGFACLLVAQPLIIAHRGASAEKPENTLAAFRRALALNVDGIELDVQLSRDGVPVVFHDATLRRLTGQPGRLTAKTWTQLQALRVHGTESIPHLTDVLVLTRGRAVVQIELKRAAAVAPVVRAIRRARAAENVILASFDLTLVREAARLAPTIPRMLITTGRGGPAAILRQMASSGAVGVSIDHRAVTSRAYVEYFRARGISLWCWTVNDARSARRLAGWGVAGLLGDNPVLLRV